MNPIQELMTKARTLGANEQLRIAEAKLREAEARALKAENEAAELRAQLVMVQGLKDKYQTVVLDLMAVLERHGLVQ